MGGFLAFVSFFVFVWAMVGLVNPSWGKLKYRRHAVGPLVLSFVMLITGAGMMDSEETAVEEPESSVSTGSIRNPPSQLGAPHLLLRRWKQQAPPLFRHRLVAPSEAVTATSSASARLGYRGNAYSCNGRSSTTTSRLA